MAGQHARPGQPAPAPDGLTGFLAARLDERTASAWAVHDLTRCDAVIETEHVTGDTASLAPACTCGLPALTLAEIHAITAVLTEYRSTGDPVLASVVWTHAAAYASHPDYLAEWQTDAQPAAAAQPA